MNVGEPILVGALTGLLAACGLVGPPIPPEDVGVAPIIERQKKRDALEVTEREAAAAAAAQAESNPVLEGQDENLPPLRPVGTR